MESTNEPLSYSELQTSEPIIRIDLDRELRRPPELSTRRIVIHSILFIITAIMTTLTGAAWSVGMPNGNGVLDSLFGPPLHAITAAEAGNFGPLGAGLVFTFSLLLILGAHEFGHYFACRHYGIRATLPFFIPAPPAPLTPFGTLGAVIKIKEPITTRRALFDIGIAGPLAGFAFAIPASFLGLIYAKAALPTPIGPGGIQFNDPVMFILITKMFKLPATIDWNPVYWAAWAALLVTALNLFPVGQLDGGHVVYAVLGPRLHRWISWITCILVATLALVSIYLYRSPIWVLWTLVLAFLLKVGHPPTMTNEPLGRARVILALLAAIVFLLCFMPFPVILH